MAIEIKIPSVGESVQEAVLAEWFKQDGDMVRKDEPLLVIETDKVTLEVAAESDGILKIIVPAGKTVAIGAVVGSLEPVDIPDTAVPAGPSEKAVTPVSETDARPSERPRPAAPVQSAGRTMAPVSGSGVGRLALSPSMRRRITEKNLDVTAIRGSGPDGRIGKREMLFHLERAATGIPATQSSSTVPMVDDAGAEVRKPMTPIRKRIAERLLASKQNTAMLTTFNEIDMSRTMEMRSRYKEAFQQRHKVALGFMSFFVKACVAALQEIPEINAFIDGGDIVYHQFQHVGVAVGTERGLVVPVIRHAQRMTHAQIEKAIVDYVAKITENRLELADLEGGTFTVSNGGVYGSLLSTPILNIPQSGILGMHKIEKRPVVVDDQIVIRPMMYVALSYDHRIVDGQGAVTFLKRVKELVENPERMALEV